MTSRILPTISLTPPKAILLTPLKKKLACHQKNTGINTTERAGAQGLSCHELAYILTHFCILARRPQSNNMPYTSDICLTAAFLYLTFFLSFSFSYFLFLAPCSSLIILTIYYFASVTLTPLNSTVPAGVSVSPILPKENTRSPAVSLSLSIEKVPE